MSERVVREKRLSSNRKTMADSLNGQDPSTGEVKISERNEESQNEGREVVSGESKLGSVDANPVEQSFSREIACKTLGNAIREEFMGLISNTAESSRALENHGVFAQSNNDEKSNIEIRNEGEPAEALYRDVNESSKIDEEEANSIDGKMNNSTDDKDILGKTELEDSGNRSENADNVQFRRVTSNLRRRNYRTQTNSSEVDDSNNQPNNREVSSSSESIDMQQFLREAPIESSDARSEVLEDNADSNDWTTASEDDIDEMPIVLQKEPSTSHYSIVKDVLSRQIGSNYSVPSHFYSSLHVVQRLELMYKLEEHLGCVNALGFNQKGNLLASASDDLTVTIWDWAIGKKNVALKTGHRSNVFQSKFLPLDVENFVVSCARDGQVRLIDIHSGVTRKLAHHRAACHKLSTHLDLPHVILSAGEDSKVLSIDVREDKPTRLLSVKESDQEVELYSIHSNPLNNFEFCVAGRTRCVKIYDRRKPTEPLQEMCPKHLLTDEYAHVTCAVYSNNGTEVVASYNSEDIYLFDIVGQKGDFAHKYQGHRNSATVKGVNFFGPNSEFVLSGSDCGNIFIWDKKTEAIVQWVAGDEQGIVNALEPHPHIPILATSGLDSDVKIWIPSREEAPNVKQELQSCVKKNLAARRRSANEAESAFAGHVLWIVLRHARQAERRRLRRARQGNSSDNDSESNDDDEDGDTLDFNYENDSSSNDDSNDSSGDSNN